MVGTLLATTVLPLAAQALLPGPTRIERAGIGNVVERLPDGGVLVAGQYTGILGGPARTGIARFASDGTLATDFDPDFEFSGVANFSSVVVAGSVAYVGGNFVRVDGQPRAGLAAIDLATRTLTPWDPAAPGSTGMRVLAASGGVVYVAGGFNTVGNAGRMGLAAVDATTGVATDWDPGQAFGVRRALVAPDGLFVGGVFSSIGTPPVSRNRLAKLDLATGAVLAFNAGITGAGQTEVRTLRLAAGSLYAGGTFSNVGGLTRNSAAAFDAATGALLAFNPNVLEASTSGQSLSDLEIEGDGVFLCGRFNRVGGQVRVGVAEVAAADGAVRALNGNLTGSFQCADLLLDGAGLIVTGSFDRAGMQNRLGLVRLARADATPDDTFPGLLQPAASPLLVAAPDGSRFVVDRLTALGLGLRAAEGVARTNLARYAPDGSHDSGQPAGPIGGINALATDGTTLFIGGVNLSPDGLAPFAPLLAFDVATGVAVTAPAVVSTQSGVTAAVRALAINGGDLLIGGTFNQVEGVAASGLAVVRLQDRMVLATPTLFQSGGANVREFSVAGGRVVFRGDFVSVDSQLRSRAAALDGTSYALLPWAPVPGPNLSAILATADRVYFGGQFSQFGTPGGPLAARNGLAAVDAVSAALLPWNPDVRITGSASCNVVGCFVSALARDGDTLYAGGAFDQVGGKPRRSLVAVDAITGTVLPFDAMLGASAALETMSVAGGTLTFAGPFERAAGARRAGIAAFDLAAVPPPDPLFANGFESVP